MRDDVSLGLYCLCRAGLRQTDWAGFGMQLAYCATAVLRICSGLSARAETAAELRRCRALWSKPENTKFILRSGHEPKNFRGAHYGRAAV